MRGVGEGIETLMGADEEDWRAGDKGGSSSTC